MSDTREKVIKDLEQFKADFKPFCGNKADWKRVDNALAMLKEQGPVKPIKSKLSFTHGFMLEIWDCGCCGNQLRSFAKYCDQCGKAVQWG